MKQRRREPTIDFSKQAYELLCRLVSPISSIPVQSTDSIVLIRPEHVAFITKTADDHLLIVDRENREWVRAGDLSKMAAALGPDRRFYACHRSFIANLYLVRKIITKNSKDWTLLFEGLPDDRMADVAAGKITEVKSRLGV